MLDPNADVGGVELFVAEENVRSGRQPEALLVNKVSREALYDAATKMVKVSTKHE